MKKMLVTVVGCLAIVFSGCVLGCGSCGGGGDSSWDLPCSSCFSRMGCSCSGTCDCTDPNCGRNPCLNCMDCCAAFGNIGAR